MTGCFNVRYNQFCFTILFSYYNLLSKRPSEKLFILPPQVESGIKGHI